MPVANFDFHFLKNDDRFQLEVYRRDSSERIATANLEFPTRS